MSKKKMAPNVKRFIAEYLIDRNGAQAAIRAGYAERSARVTASRLLANANVLEEIQAAEDEALRRLAITRSTLIREAWKAFIINSEMIDNETVNQEGDVIKTKKEMRDSAAAHKFFDTVAKMTGSYEKDNRVVSEVVYKWQ